MFIYDKLKLLTNLLTINNKNKAIQEYLILLLGNEPIKSFFVSDNKRNNKANYINKKKM